MWDVAKYFSTVTQHSDTSKRKNLLNDKLYLLEKLSYFTPSVAKELYPVQHNKRGQSLNMGTPRAN